MNFLREKLVLASSSPRRTELLNRAGWPHEVIVAAIDESVRAQEEPAAYVERLARSKAEAVAQRLEAGLVLGADTTVVVQNQMLGQPLDDADACRMLNLLSGKWHDVLTGVALVRVDGETRVAHETTRVRFAAMGKEEIDWYVASGEPVGKAGAYGIQGRAALFIEEIEGDYFNIMGLPIRLVYQLAAKDLATKRHKDKGD